MEKMTFEEFIEAARAEISERMPECKVFINKVKKNNGLLLTGISIYDQETNISPTIYLDDIYEAIQNGNVDSVDEACDSIIALYEKNNSNVPFDVSGFADFEKAKGKICFKLINREKNASLLEEIPHEDFLDLAVEFFVFLNDVAEVPGGGYGSILIRNEHLQMWGVDLATIKKAAMENTPKLMPNEVMGLDLAIDREMRHVRVFDIETVEKNSCCIRIYRGSDLPLYIASNNRSLNGAGAILYDGVLRDFASYVDDDFYIIPLSIHETMIMPAKLVCDADDIRNTIGIVNNTSLRDEEVLSNSLYFYSREKDEIVIAA